MLFKRFYDDNLAQASYLVACERSREAIVVDPTVDVAQYTRAAGAERVKISHVTETHIHADFVSGARALAAATGATLYLSAEGGKEWGYADSALANARTLQNDSEIEFGDIRLRALHTPGHTPEHITLLVTDRERGDDPVGAFTGDFVFVGDVGRPDLLERAAGARGSTEKAAVQLFQSIQRFKALPDYLQIWPGHGAGSACGKSLGSMPQTTLGYEKLFNWAFAETSEANFARRVVEDQPVPPRYFATMKKVNRVGGGASIAIAKPKDVGLGELEAALRRRATIVDARPVAAFAEGHIPGTINIPRNRSFLNWFGALVPANGEVFLITDAESDDALQELASDLAKIGFANVSGYFAHQILHEWTAKRGELERVAQLGVETLHSGKAGQNPQIVDVRGPDEWKLGHLPGAIHIPLAALPDRVEELNGSGPIVLQCKGGSRSAIATSFLQARGLSNVSNLVGGYTGWVKSGFEVEGDASSPTNRSPRKS
jgi:hydroxyacylglutathione hydrolase